MRSHTPEAAPRIGLEKSLIYIRNLENCPPSYLNDPGRKDFFEIVWLQNEYPLHAIKEEETPELGDWIYLIPPYRVHQLNKAGKNGILLSFKRDFLEEEDKEFYLDIFKIFNIQGEFSCLPLTAKNAAELAKVFQLLDDEYKEQDPSFLILKALLKVFLLKLIQIKEHVFTAQDVNQKRVYEFMMLLEQNYQLERNAEFYATSLGISSKRLNQVLKEKLDKTAMQLIHDRIILEAKRKIIHSENTLKEIAFDLGFTDRPYFSRFFKKQTGLPPEEFQRQAHHHIETRFNTLV
ncbi:helix-turn-helix domain-containing protein [Pedobacter metabolipauper]|uniref:AraC-like DNA-binding protein n=1 Tax=Pedobacter metabolipauper TaxID=425513 RepID=A0A4V6PW01_9SPHI|nr:helix-turn-helix domain-containing protein [Pedobacter metabolipauper]TDQ08194.1 AraC-like DNA-binding protein [Pedobacter metabolipauper]